ncbi:zinc finger protein 853-like isoform X2 [Palaemon carinicauda]|uniref:zinc finger protein 853-like isoform X2 n=1 Tax=Palaemon carinicauda TaxID=392227 RepID=UPI0035B699BB
MPDNRNRVSPQQGEGESELQPTSSDDAPSRHSQSNESPPGEDETQQDAGRMEAAEQSTGGQDTTSETQQLERPQGEQQTERRPSQQQQPQQQQQLRLPTPNQDSQTQQSQEQRRRHSQNSDSQTRQSQQTRRHSHNTDGQTNQLHPQPQSRRASQNSVGRHSQHSDGRHSQQSDSRHSQHSEGRRSPHSDGQSGRQQSDILDHQQGPAVLVVQQPIILGRGAYIRRGQPFMYRGVQLGNGRKIGMNCMITLGLFGGMLILWGIAHGVNTLHGFICVTLGAIQLGSCFRLCYKAKQDFDSLPQDHPDRVTYSSPIVLSREAREIASNTTTYQLPPGAQIISSSPLRGGHGAPTYQLPAGAQVISSSSTVDGRLAPPAFLHQAFGGSSSRRSSAQEDKPPSYEDACKQMRH